MKNMLSPIKYGPAVCAAGENYIIAVPVKRYVLMKITVGNNTYLNTSNGIRILEADVQKFIIAQNVLDSAGKYTVICNADGKEYSKTYNFRPVSSEDELRIYHISDTHGLYKEAVSSARPFRNKTDLLIMNGDISSSSNKISDILLTYKIAYAVTKGEIPCIITRGNHDLRGDKAEHLPELMPYPDGKPYFTVKLKNIWFLILDCGEDKLDTHVEYHGKVAFHDFRLKETDFINKIIADKDSGYNASDIKKKIMISHIAFNHRDRDMCNGERPFNIEDEIYSKWCELINDCIKPDLYITGHMHTLEVHPAGSTYNDRNLCCTTIIGGKPSHGKNPSFSGAYIEIYDNGADVRFSSSSEGISPPVEIKF